MQIQLRFFAALRETLGPQAVLEVPDGATVGTVRDRLIGQDDRHAQALGRERLVRTALNHTLCEESAVLRHGDELAFFPPVTGG